MPLIAAPFLILALAAIVAIGGGLVAKKEGVTSDEHRLWALIVKAQESGKPDDFVAAANLARLIGKPKTADQLFIQAKAAGDLAKRAQIASAARAALTRPHPQAQAQAPRPRRRT